MAVSRRSAGKFMLKTRSETCPSVNSSTYSLMMIFLLSSGSPGATSSSQSIRFRQKIPKKTSAAHRIAYIVARESRTRRAVSPVGRNTREFWERTPPSWGMSPGLGSSSENKLSKTAGRRAARASSNKLATFAGCRLAGRYERSRPAARNRFRTGSALRPRSSCYRRFSFAGACGRLPAASAVFICNELVCMGKLNVKNITIR